MRICVPITATTTKEALADIAIAEEMGADILELRLDFLEDFSNENLATLLSARTIPAIVTLRLQQEGGHWQGGDRKAYFQQAIDLGAEFIDLEFQERFNLDRNQTKLIYSFHDFQSTPADLDQLYHDMLAAGADIAKIVTTGNPQAILDLQKKGPEHLIAICMGQDGRETRLRGSYLTFAALNAEKSSAPGQLSIAELIAARKKLNIALIGGRGSGKSTYARTFKDKKVYSTDAMIEDKTGLPIKELIAKKGWPHFRDLEYEALKELLPLENIIIDCGGGIICEQEADGQQIFSARKAAILERLAHVIWLNPPLETQLERLATATDRPALNEGQNFLEEMSAVMELRRPWYQRVADEER